MTEPDFLRLTREGYDSTAEPYAARFQNYLDERPVDRAMLSAFADLIRQRSNVRVADVGCGTGVATAMLADLGVDPFGIDLSPNMIAEARRHSPGLEFSVGSMTDLDLPSGSVGGVCAWYSTIHIPDEHLPRVLAEFHRVLIPGGLALVAFQAGDERKVLTEVFDHAVELTFRRRRPEAVGAALESAGLPVWAQMVRQPIDDGVESTPQAYLIARKG